MKKCFLSFFLVAAIFCFFIYPGIGGVSEENRMRVGKTVNEVENTKEGDGEKGVKGVCSLDIFQGELSVEGVPSLNNNFSLFFNLIPRQDFSNTKIRYLFPESIEVIDLTNHTITKKNEEHGFFEQTIGNIYVGNVYDFEFKLKAKKPGLYKVKVYVEGEGQYKYKVSKNYNLFIQTSSTSGSVSHTPPEEFYEMIEREKWFLRIQDREDTKNFQQEDSIEQQSNSTNKDMPKASVLIQGYFKFRDYDQTFQTYYGFMVELWEIGAFGIPGKIDETHTDDNGYYLFSLDVPSSRTLFVRVISKGYYWVDILGPNVWDGNGIKDSSQFTVYYNTYTYTVPTLYGTEDYWKVVKYIKIALDWVWDHTSPSYKRSIITVRYPSGTLPGYNAFYDTIYLPENDGVWAANGIYHEYGHGIMREAIGYSNWPTFSCNFNDVCNHCTTHCINGRSNLNFAFIEGWAEFVQCAIPNQAGNIGCPCWWGDIDFNTWYEVHNVTYMCSEMDDSLDGDITEGSIASILWDFWDGADGDDNDYLNFSLSFSKIFYVIKNHKATDIHKFWDGWKEDWTVGLNEWKVFYHYGIWKYDVPLPDIEQPITSINFGNVEVGDSSDKTTRIYNDGAGILTINDISRSGSSNFIHVSPSTPFNINPWSYRDVTVRFSPSSSGLKTAEFNVNSNDPDEPNVPFSVSGNGVTIPDIRTPIGSISFGDVEIGSSSTKTTRIYNDGTGTLSVNSISRSGSSDFTCVSPSTPFTIGAGSYRDVSIKFSPSSTGLKSAQFTVNSNDPDEPNIPFSVSGNGFTKPDIRTPIGSINFGDVNVGSSLDKTTRIYNDGTAGLTVNSISQSGSSDFTYTGPSTPFTIDAGSYRDVTVRFSPSSGGGKSAQFTVNSNDPDEPGVPFDVSGNGVVVVVPDIRTPIGSINFGDVNVGSSLDKTTRIYNDGTGALTVNSISRSGSSDFTYIGPSTPFTIDAGNYRDVTIRFSPSSSGAKSAQFTVNSNDPDEPNVLFDVSGNGVTISIPEINIKQGAGDIPDGGVYDFGSVLIGTVINMTFTIENTGTADLTLDNLPLQITGVNTDQFSVQEQPVSPVSQDNSTTFVIRFHPTFEGPKTASIAIENNDGDEDPYDITFNGNGIGDTDPVINHIVPSSGPVGSHVTISGSNFGSAVGTVTFNGVSAQILAWSDTQIGTIVPDGAASGLVVVHTYDGKDSSGVFFSVGPGDEQTILIIDLDGNRNSGPEIQNAIEANGYNTDYITALPQEINPDLYPATFVCLGIYSLNHVLAVAEGEVLKNYLDSGGNLYMEGGDTWYFDTVVLGMNTPVHPYFGIMGLDDGTNDTDDVMGIPGRFTEGFGFAYEVDNNWMDHIDIALFVLDAFIIWDNIFPLYHNGVARDTGNYKTIGVSFEFGGIPDSQQIGIMEEYLNFLSPLPTITVTSPNGGESWEVASSHAITWTGTGSVGNVDIEYSIDDGNTWTMIAASTPNDGTRNWIVPDTPSEKCLIRISETDGSPSDVSDGVFEIAPAVPTITITSPNGGERWEVGSWHNITWTSTGTVGDVKIEYSNNGTPWRTIVNSTANDGSYNWRVPNEPAENGLIRIRETDNDPSDVSDGVFSIVMPASITVTSPNGGETWEVGSEQKITWTSTGDVGNIKIEYSPDSGLSWTAIVTSTSNDGIYQWTVPANSSTGYLIRVSEIDGDPWDVSDGVFTIAAEPQPGITVISPNGGENLTAGSTHEITWTSTGDVGNVVIEYSTNSGGSWKRIVVSTANDGSYNWPVPDDPSHHCLVRISENDADRKPTDVSNSVFSIVSPSRASITVTSPNNGETLIIDTTYEITWTSTGTIDKVDIEYSPDRGTSWTTIASSTPNDGSYQWTVPNTPSSYCLVRVSDSSTDGGASDVSDAGFSIVSPTVAAITVISPNGGERWKIGFPHQLTWRSTGTVGNVKIEYSTNGGSLWTTIAASTANDGTYTWTVPNLPSESCLIRVSEADGDPSDVSDDVFAIVVPPSITVTSPNGGENREALSSYDITWTNAGTIDKVKIEYSTDSGTSWTTIINCMDNSGSYSWTIPDTPSNYCLVRISDCITDGGPSDVSDGVFSIVLPSAPTIKVTSPDGDERLIADSMYEVTWKSIGNVGNIKIECSTNGGESWTEIIASMSNDGSYDWTVPDMPSENCLIRISDTDGEPSDISDSVFSIVSPATASITVTSPNGGETLNAGSTHEITWTGTGTIEHVIIEYSTDEGASWANIVTSAANNGSYDWIVPDTPSENCLVRISGNDLDSDPSDVSDAVFEITAGSVPTITVTSPNGGEGLIIGSTHEITWFSTGTIDNVMIEYSMDNGTSWAVITASTVNGGSYDWTVPDTPSDSCLVRISGNESDEAPWDVSDTIFSIISDTSPCAKTWLTGSYSGSDTFTSVTYGNSKFVAVGKGGVIMTGSNGIRWTTQASGTSSSLEGVIWGDSDNKFAAVGSGGVILTSSDGANWTVRSPSTNKDLHGVAYGNGKFAAVGVGGVILTSSDGITWETQSSGTAKGLQGIVYGSGKFAAVGDSGLILTSSDGINWNRVSSGTANTIYGITYGDNMFAAVGDEGVVLTSSNGSDWDNRTAGINTALFCAANGNSRFVIVGKDGKILISSDGMSWEQSSSGVRKNLCGVVYGNSIFVAVGEGTILYSLCLQE